jgi:integrase
MHMISEQLIKLRQQPFAMISGRKAIRIHRLGDVIDDFYISMESVVSKSTITWYKSRIPSLLSYFGEDRDVSSITIGDLRRWRLSIANVKVKYANHPTRKKIEGSYSPSTIHQYVRACRRLFRWMKDEDIIQENPAKRLELPPVPIEIRRGIKMENEISIIAAARNNPRDYAITRFLADTAARVGGVSGLKLDDLELEKRRAFVHEKGRGGNNKTRAVFYSEETAGALRAWLAVRPHIENLDYVFLGKFHGHYDRLYEGGIYHMLERYAKKLGIPKGYNPHNWRHRRIRNLLVGGISLPEASQIAGHSSVRVTGDIYGTFDENELQRRADECSTPIDLPRQDV